MRLRLIRHATLELDYAGRRLLLDPMLDPAGARGPVAGHAERPPQPAGGAPRAGRGDRGARRRPARHPPPRRPPRRRAAVALLAGERPVLCQPRRRRRRCATAGSPACGRSTRRSRSTASTSPAPAGSTAPGSSLRCSRRSRASCCVRTASRPSTSPATPSGATTVRAAIDAHAPDVVVVNAGGARFIEGDPIVMTADDVVAVARHARGAHVVAVHLEAINHCLETRAELTRPPARGGRRRQRACGRRRGLNR